jgi:hypothetical protein
VLAVVGLGRGLDADRRLSVDGPVRDVVQVLLEDPLLRPLLLELLGHLGLADLALEVARRVLDVERADELLGDRGPALDRLARGDVLHAGADHALEVDSLVLVEAPVLDRDRRLPDRDRHVLPHDRRALLGRLDVAEPGAVGRVDDRARALVDRLELVDVGRRGGHGDHPGDRREHDQHGDRDEHAETQQHPAANMAMAAALAYVSLAVGHGRRSG